ncbi:MAG: hypothetical protein V3S44_00465 [Alphaproteobacteria bacterium]
MSFEPVRPRARLGFIIPSSNRLVEPQIQLHAPDGVAVHFTRIGMTNRHKAPLPELMPRFALAAELLGDSTCDVIVLQCTGTSMSGGLDGEREVIQTMEAASGRPALTTASCLMTALAALKARRLVFVSETARDGHDAKRAFLEQAGYDIVADRAAGLAGSDVYCTTPPEFWFDFVRAQRNDRAQAYFVSCANIHSIDVIAALEAELGRPVVTSNQVALWCALRTAGIDDAIPALGHLFDLGLPASAQAAQ